MIVPAPSLRVSDWQYPEASARSQELQQTAHRAAHRAAHRGDTVVGCFVVLLNQAKQIGTHARHGAITRQQARATQIIGG